MREESQAERVALGVAGAVVFGALLLGISGVRLPLPWAAGPGPTALREPAIKLPYDATMKGSAHLLPCCNAGVALAVLNVSDPEQEQELKSGYLSGLPTVDKGVLVTVRAFYALHGDNLGQLLLLYPTPERLTGGTAALVETASGATGYVAAPLVFPP